MKRKLVISVISLTCLLGLINCSSYDFRQRIIQQGNLIPDEKLSRLKIGMTKPQVATLMGTSLVYPMFSTNRWDYAYTYRIGSSKQEQRKAELFFKQGRLSRIVT